MRPRAAETSDRGRSGEDLYYIGRGRILFGPIHKAGMARGPAGQSSGGNCAGDTPVPIPNTVVKARSADGTASYQRWENRSPPDTLRQWRNGRRARFRI